MMISVPAETANLDNLNAIIEIKSNLIKTAFSLDEVRLADDGDKKIAFDWFPDDCTQDELNAYMLFVTYLCRYSKSVTRINKTKTETPNEKYAFRCFLLRLGFIGDNYKAARKILLRNFTGSASFKKAK